MESGDEMARGGPLAPVLPGVEAPRAPLRRTSEETMRTPILALIVVLAFGTAADARGHGGGGRHYYGGGHHTSSHGGHYSGSSGGSSHRGGHYHSPYGGGHYGRHK